MNSFGLGICKDASCKTLQRDLADVEKAQSSKKDTVVPEGIYTLPHVNPKTRLHSNLQKGWDHTICSEDLFGIMASKFDLIHLDGQKRCSLSRVQSSDVCLQTNCPRGGN